MSIRNIMNLVNTTMPYAWDDSLSVYEMLGKLITKINEVVALVNLKLPDDFETTFYQTFREYTKEEMQRIVDSGEFAAILDSMTVEFLPIKQELIDARDGEVSVGAKIRSVDDQLAQKAENDILNIYAKDLGVTSECYLFKGKNKNIIIDFGHDFSASDLIGYALSKGINKIDYAIITHYHGDHVGGLEEFVNSVIDFSECVFIIPPTPKWGEMTGPGGLVSQNREFEVINFLNLNNISYKNPKNNEIIEIQDNLSFKFLNVGEQFYTHYYDALITNQGNEQTDTNNFAMVVEVVHNATKILFPSDINIPAQKQLAPFLSSYDIVTIEHHALNVTSDESYLDKISPKIALAMNGTDTNLTRNESIKNLWFSGSQIFTTGVSGDIHLKNQNNSTVVYTDKGSFVNREMLKSDYHLDVSHFELIRENNDLNDFNKAGVYLSGSVNISKSLENSPTKSTFRLICEHLTGSGSIQQRIITNDVENKTYNRIYHANGWYEWKEVITSKTLIDKVVESNPWLDIKKYITIKTGDDLNDFVDIGVYMNGSGAITPSLLNKPETITASSFKLITENILGLGLVKQSILVNGVHSPKFVRTRVGGDIWGEWKEVIYKKDVENLIRQIIAEQTQTVP